MATHWFSNSFSMLATHAGFSHFWANTGTHTPILNLKSLYLTEHIALNTLHIPTVLKHSWCQGFKFNAKSCVPILYVGKCQGFEFSACLCVLIPCHVIWTALHCDHWSFESVRYYPVVTVRIQAACTSHLTIKNCLHTSYYYVTSGWLLKNP